MLDAFLSYIETLDAHVMCGDFNIPRLSSIHSMKSLLNTIPIQFPFHMRRASTQHFIAMVESPDKRQMFESFMVDYVFTQPPYTAHGVRLEFGISDHAAVVATIGKSS